MRSLKHTYLDLDLRLLRTISEMVGIELESRTGRTAAVELASTMQDPGVLDLVVAGITKEDRHALDELLGAGGRMPVATYARRFGEVRPLGSGARERERPHLYPERSTESLWYRGLIGRAFRDDGDGPQEFFYVPDELRCLLQSSIDVAKPIIRIMSISPAQEDLELARSTLVDDACTLIAYLRLVSPTGKSTTSISQLSECLDLHPYLHQPSALYMLLHLVQELELVAGDPLRVNPAKARPFLQATRGEQLRALVLAWHNSVKWRDIFYVPGLRFEEPAPRVPDACKARQGIIEQLAQLAPREWIEMSSFVSHMRERAPDFQRLAGDYDSWHVFDCNTGERLRGFENWDRVDGPLITFLIRGPLHWLGIADICVEPVGFRLTSAGDVLWGGGGTWEIKERSQPMLVSVDGLLQADRTTSRADRFLAARIGEWEKSDDENKYLYQMTASSLRQAAEAGIACDQVLAFLERASGRPVPKQLQKAARRFSQSGVEAELCEMLVLRVRSETFMRRLREHPKINRYLGDALGPLTVEVRSSDWKHLCREMLDLGVFLGRGQ